MNSRIQTKLRINYKARNKNFINTFLIPYFSIMKRQKVGILGSQIIIQPNRRLSYGKSNKLKKPKWQIK